MLACPKATCTARKSCSTEYARLAKRCRSLCGVHPGGNARPTSLPNHPGDMWPLSKPGNTHEPAAAIRLANIGGQGTRLTCPPLPTTRKNQPVPTGSTSLACTRAHSARRKPHTAIISTASLILGSALSRTSLMSGSGMGRATGLGRAILGSPRVMSPSTRPVCSHHCQNDRSDALAPARADGPTSRPANHLARSVWVILSICLSMLARARRTCDNRT